MDKNLTTYNSKPVVAWYDQLTAIVPAEKTLFEHYEKLIAQASLLDIGIGGGRTTAYLAGRCKTYTGIDYSQAFADRVKEKYPALTILKHDARDLSAFSDHSFDVVNFSFNGIDYVDLTGREKIFSEIHRVLKTGGIFLFSTHNRDHSSFDEWPWLDKKISAFIKLKTFIKLIPFLNRKFINKKLETINSRYAIINDSAHNYGLMTFYTSPEFLKEQLQYAGFQQVQLLNKAGKHVPDSQLDDWIFVTAKKSA